MAAADPLTNEERLAVLSDCVRELLDSGATRSEIVHVVNRLARERAVPLDDAAMLALGESICPSYEESRWRIVDGRATLDVNPLGDSIGHLVVLPTGRLSIYSARHIDGPSAQHAHCATIHPNRLPEWTEVNHMLICHFFGYMWRYPYAWRMSYRQQGGAGGRVTVVGGSAGGQITLTGGAGGRGDANGNVGANDQIRIVGGNTDSERSRS